MRKFLIGLLLAVSLSGCAVQTETNFSTKIYTGDNFVSPGLNRIHDDELNVTCWVVSGYSSVAIDCISDSELDNE